MAALARVVLPVLLGSVACNAAAYAAAARQRRPRPLDRERDDRHDAPWPAHILGWAGIFLRGCGVTALRVPSVPLTLRRRPLAEQRGAGRRPVVLLPAELRDGALGSPGLR